VRERRVGTTGTTFPVLVFAVEINGLLINSYWSPGYNRSAGLAAVGDMEGLAAVGDMEAAPALTAITLNLSLSLCRWRRGKRLQE
jgi:hypothetical protein